MESETPTLRDAPSAGSTLPLPGAEHRSALLRYATRLLERAAEHAAEVVDGALVLAARDAESSSAGGAEGAGKEAGADGEVQGPRDPGDRTVEKLFAAVRRQALARMRSEGIAQRTAAVDGDDTATSLTQRVERLTPKQREVVWLKFSHGFGYEAISGITGLSVHNAGFLLHSALTNLYEASAPGARATAGDDERVTEYVLEEMNAPQQAAFEEALRHDATLKTALAEMRGLAGELQATFGNSDEVRQRTKKKKRRGAGGALRWAKRILIGGAGLGAVGGVLWWFSRPPDRKPAAKADEAETFQLRPDVWKLAKARAEREEREGRAGVGGGASGSATGAAARPSKAAGAEKTDAAGKPADVDKPAGTDKPEPGSRAENEKQPAQNEKQKARAEKSKVRPADDEAVPLLPNAAGADGAGAAGAANDHGAETAADGPVKPGAAGSPTASAGAPGRGKDGALKMGTAGGSARAMGDFSEATAGGAKDATLPAAAGGARNAPTKAARAPAATTAVAKAKSAATVRGAGEAGEKAGSPMGELDAVRGDGDASAALAAVRPALAKKGGPTAKATGPRELLDYFPAEATVLAGSPDVAVAVEVADAPWAPERRLVRVVLTAAPPKAARSASANVVLLLDVSSSMDTPTRLPLVQEATRRLLNDLRPEDRVGIVTYAGEARVALSPTPMTRAAEIRTVLAAIHAEGMTNGGAGLRRAYEVAHAGFVPGGVNRVVLCTDGDFNMGMTSESELATLVETEARGGVGLAVFGFGRGRQIDPRLEALAAKGRGGSGNVNTRREAARRMTAEVNGWGAAVASDLHVEFDCDPARVAACRLVGYDENFLPPETADRSRLEVGELAAGESVVALFELIPLGADRAVGENSPPWLTVRASHTPAAGSPIRTQRVEVREPAKRFPAASAEFKFSAAVAGLGLALREAPPSPKRLAAVVAWAEAAVADRSVRDPGGYRDEFLALAREAREVTEK